MLGSLFKRRESYNKSTTVDSSSSSPTNSLPLNYSSHSYLHHPSASVSNNFASYNASLNSPFIINGNDDSYTATLLYGSNSIPQPAFKLSDKTSCSRLLILQDGGIRHKQTLFDSAISSQHTNSGTTLQSLNSSESSFPTNPVNAPSLNKSIYHSVNELSGYMFGYYGILINETTSATKFHYLPPLPSMPKSVLVTRLFSLDPTFKPRKPAFDNPDDYSDWAVQPSVHNDDSLNSNSVQGSTRYAIGLVIPISNTENSMKDIVTDNWDEILNQLVKIQKQVTDKLRLLQISQRAVRKPGSLQPHQLQQPQQQTHKSCNIGTTHGNIPKKLCFPVHSLQNDYDIHQSLQLFIRSLIFLVETPRLFISLQNSDYTLIHWASTVAAWLELKDGRQTASLPSAAEISPPEMRSPSPYSASQSNSHPLSASYLSSSISATAQTTMYPPTGLRGLKFLAALISVLIPIRNQIIERPTHKAKAVVTRVVIITGNPIVSQKLIFILAGLIGYEYFQFMVGDDPASSAESTQGSSVSGGNSTIVNQVLAPKSSTNTLNDKNTASDKNINSIPAAFLKRQDHGNDDNDVVDDAILFTKPIPILRQNSDMDTSSNSSSLSPNNYQSSSITKGWEIPTKSTISSSPVYRNLETAKPERPIQNPHVRRTSSYASLQNLSTSYNSQATPSSSWRNSHFGSFVDRLRFSSTSGNNIPVGSSLGGSTITSGLMPQGFNNVSAITNDGLNPSISNETTVFMTPSPSTEYEDYPWKVSSPSTTPSNSVHRLSKAISAMELNSTFNNAGTFGLGGHASYKSFGRMNNNNRFSAKDTVNVERTSTSLTLHDQLIDLKIKDKINNIMNQDLNYEISVENDIKVLTLPPVVSPSPSSSNDSLRKNGRLPLLTSYIEQYRPEFSLMSCPQHRNLESQIIESMKNDICKLGPGSKTQTFLINLRQREIKHIELDHPSSAAMTSQYGSVSPCLSSLKPTTTKIFSPSMKQRSDIQQQQQPSSMLSTSMASTSSSFLSGSNINPNNGNSQQTLKDHVNNQLVDEYDAKLNNISELVNRINYVNSLKTNANTNGDLTTNGVIHEDSVYDGLPSSKEATKDSDSDNTNNGNKDSDSGEFCEADGCEQIRLLIEQMLELSSCSTTP